MIQNCYQGRLYGAMGPHCRNSNEPRPRPQSVWLAHVEHGLQHVRKCSEQQVSRKPRGLLNRLLLLPCCNFHKVPKL
jgi:hypothetical protein